MKDLRPLLLSTLLGLAMPAAGSTPAAEARAADAAFAARAAEIGQHGAFIEYLADDAVLFRPEAVAGQQWLAAHEPAGGRLEWSPVASAAECTGRLAVTTGSWRYSNAQGGEPVEGHYLSIWRLGEEGQWRVVLDHGIDHASGAAPAIDLQAALERHWPAVPPGECTGRADARRLARAERDLNAAIARRGLAAALPRAAAEGALAYRDDAAPGLLASAVAAADAEFGPGGTAQSAGSVHETGAGLAVTHGVIGSADGARRALYVRLWRRDGRRWTLAVDMRTPLPAP